MEQFLHNNSIFIVLTIVMMIFFGLIIYVFTVDRKLTKLEKMLEDDPHYHNE